MTFLGVTRVSAQERTAAPGSVRRAAPDAARGLYRAVGNRALADLGDGAVLQRCPGGCQDGGCTPMDEQVLARTPVEAGPAVAPPIVDSVLGSAGQPLDARSRTAMESRFGHDFGAVRLHTGAMAARSARAVGASAYTVGSHVVLGEEFVAGTAQGQRLLAHELTHVVQQKDAPARTAGTIPVGGAGDPLEHEAHAMTERVTAGATVDVRGRGGGQAVRREPRPVTRKAGPVDWKPGMRATLLDDVVAERSPSGDPVRTVKAGTLVEVVANPGFGVIQVQPVDVKLRTRRGAQVNDSWLEPVGSVTQADPTVPVVATIPVIPTIPVGSANPVAVPVPVEFELLDDGSGTGWVAAMGRSTAITAARDIGYLISPPIRGGLDPLLPLASRLRVPGSLSMGGDVATLERYLTNPFKELTPRYAGEAAELFIQQSHGTSWWMNNFGLTERQLSEMPGLVARVAEGGVESLAPAEQTLLMTFLQAHAQNVAAAGEKIASPALSTTVREGLSAVPEATKIFRDAPYVVRIRVPANAVLDVNATMGAQRLPSLVYEAEVLVFTDARGAVTNIQPNRTSTLGKATPKLRWVGRGMLLLGVLISVGRIATATPQELPRVVGEETGGWIGGAAGSALVAGGCIALGIVTEGVGLLVCGALGGIGGGLGGSYLGGEVGERLGNQASESAKTLGQVVNPLIERAIYGSSPIPPLGYDPSARDRDR